MVGSRTCVYSCSCCLIAYEGYPANQGRLHVALRVVLPGHLSAAYHYLAFAAAWILSTAPSPSVFRMPTPLYMGVTYGRIYEYFAIQNSSCQGLCICMQEPVAIVK